MHFKRDNLKAAIYPSLLFFVLLLLAVPSFLFIRHLSVVTNRVIVSPEAAAESVLTLNIDDYNTVAAKMGLPAMYLNSIEDSDTVSEPDDSDEPTIVTTTPTSDDIGTSATTTATSTAVEVPVRIDKTALRIAVYNGTNVSGLAANLRDALTAIGFSNITIGSVVTTTTGTVIQIKESFDAVYADIATEVGKTCPAVTRQTLGENTEYDVWITIGR